MPQMLHGFASTLTAAVELKVFVSQKEVFPGDINGHGSGVEAHNLETCFILSAGGKVHLFVPNFSGKGPMNLFVARGL